MNTDSLNKWLTLTANIGVLAGILFLGFELRQNNELLTAQGRAVRAELRQASFVLMVENRDLRLALVKSQNDETLTPDEQILVRTFMSQVIINWQSSWLEFDAELLDLEDLSPEGWRTDFHKNQALANQWQEMRYRLRSDFVAWMEENVVSE
jgi:hypothetical protein